MSYSHTVYSDFALIYHPIHIKFFSFPFTYFLQNSTAHFQFMLGYQIKIQNQIKSNKLIVILRILNKYQPSVFSTLY